MTTRPRGLYLLLALTLPLVVTLSACSAAGVREPTPPPGRGAIELALAGMCEQGTDTTCTPVNGESITTPSAFERADVEAAAAVAGAAQSAVDVTFTDEGAAVLHTLTEQAAGGSQRLVMKVGDEIIAAIVVAEPLEGKQVQIALSNDADAQRMADLIQGR